MDNSTEQDLWLSFVTSCPNTAVCIVEVTVVIAVSFHILVGNIGNLTILLSTPKLRNSHGYLLISLSVADLMTGLNATLAVYPSATLRSRPDSWPYGDTACLITAYINQVGITNSAINLMLLSVERYIAVAHPLRYSRIVTKKLTLICIAVVWLLSAAVYSTIFAGFPGHFYFSQIYVCLPMLFDNPLLVWILLVTVLTPVLIIMVTSCIVSRKLHTAGPRNGADIATSASRTNIKVKTFRMVQVMTATFILCYIPFFTVLFVSILAYVTVPQVVIFGVYWLLLANSFFNTIIYFRMNTTYRKRMGEILNFMADWVSLKLNSAEKTESNSARFNTVDSNKLQCDPKTSFASLSTQCHDSVL